VAVTPQVAGRLVSRGHTLLVERGAGLRSGYTDDEYRAAGADSVEGEVAWACDLVATVALPQPATLFTGRSLLGLLRPFDQPDAIGALATGGAILWAFEAVPRTTRAQTVDALSSQATAAGYQAAIEAARECDRFFPMLTTAAGTLPPARVLVLGAGVAGLQAIATARRLGALVEAFDVRREAAEQVRSLGASFVEIDVELQDASAAGGYAREVEEESRRRILAGLRPRVEAADAVITTAAIPGRRAPVLVTRDMVESMRPGAVIVDLSASTGGNCELTQPDRTVDHRGVRIIGDTHLVSRVARDASQMLARNVAAFVDLVTGEDGSLDPDWSDDIVSSSCVARDGRMTHPWLEAPS
jgi:NAD(P) transhydrogenase subunit alpha